MQMMKLNNLEQQSLFGCNILKLLYIYDNLKLRKNNLSYKYTRHQNLHKKTIIIALTLYYNDENQNEILRNPE